MPAPVVFAPASQAVAFYNDPPVEPAPPHPIGDEFIKAMETFYADPRVRFPRPAADGRLYRVARELAEVTPEDDQSLPYPVIEFALQRNGIIEPTPRLVIAWGTLSSPQSIVTELMEKLAPVLAGEEFTRIGVGSAVRKDGDEGAVVLVLQTSDVSTKPIPRELPRGGTIPIVGKLLGKHRDPEIFVTREDGTVAQPAVKVQASSFRAEVSCQGRRGRQQIEITGMSEKGPRVLANFPVWCNERAPASLTIEPSFDDPLATASEAGAEKVMLALVNRDRARHGLPALIDSPELAAVARAHSRDMRKTNDVAHVSKTTGTVDMRVRAASIDATVVLENVARAYGVNEAEDGLMNSPGHRANILSNLSTHAGIGIVFGKEAAGQRELFVTQVFIRTPPVITAAAAEKSVHAMLQAVRPVVRDARLSALAQEHAQKLAQGTAPDAATRETSHKLDALAKQYRRVATVSTALVDVVLLDAAGVLDDKAMTHYGLGVAEGKHAETGPDTLFVVVLLGQLR